jgi:hypothetical protein
VAAGGTESAFKSSAGGFGIIGSNHLENIAKSSEFSLTGLKQKLSPNKAQTGFISRKYVHIFLQPAHKSIRYSCSKSF